MKKGLLSKGTPFDIGINQNLGGKRNANKKKTDIFSNYQYCIDGICIVNIQWHCGYGRKCPDSRTRIFCHRNIICKRFTKNCR